MMSCFIVLAAGVASQPPTSAGEVLIDRNRLDRTAPAAPPSSSPSPPPVTPVIEAASDVTIRGIRFIGVAAPASVAAAARPFIGSKADRATLSKLATALSHGYGKSSVAFYTVMIPQQQFAGGIVIVRLVEARVAAVDIKAPPRRHPLLRRRFRKFLVEQPLSRDTFERETILVRDTPGLTVNSQITDPQGTGALTLTANPEQRRVKLSAGFSNRGINRLGDGQFDVQLKLFGVVTDGDALTAAASGATDIKSYRYAAASYGMPIGSSGLNLATGFSYLDTRPRDNPIQGRAKQVTLALSYPLVRRFHESADISLGIDGLNSDNAAFGNLISSESSRAVRLAASVTDQRTRRLVSASISASHGLNVLGASVVPGLADPTFTKVNIALSFNQAIGKRLVLRLSGSDQWSVNPLPAAERFAIGGEAIGRAFNVGLLTGDRGGGGLGELAWLPIRHGWFGTSELYSFVDGGDVSALRRGPVAQQEFSLASVGGGARLKWRDKAELGLEAAHAIDRPYAGYRENWRLSVEWRLNLNGS